MDRQGVITTFVVISVGVGLAVLLWGSQLAHATGMMMVHHGVSLPQAVAWCGSSFRYGCLHGAVMEYVAQNFSGPLDSSILTVCDQFTSAQYLNCTHGIGHAFVKHNDVDLPDLVALCTDHTACVSGVYMEYALPLPCDDLAPPNQAYCRSSERYYAIMGLW